MGLQSVPLTSSGVVAFMRNNFAAATFDKPVSAGEVVLVWDCTRVLCFVLMSSRSFRAADSNSTVIDGQFVVLGSVLLKYAQQPPPPTLLFCNTLTMFERAASSCETLHGFVTLCGAAPHALQASSWTQIRCPIWRVFESCHFPLATLTVC